MSCIRHKYLNDNTFECSKYGRQATTREMETKARAHVVVTGRVQGVYYRYATREEAVMRGVKGWIRNLKDGRVEAVFEGEKSKVEEVIDFCHYGPSAAKVSSMEVTWDEYTGEFKGLSIRYR
jgi:acylphosphatase